MCCENFHASGFDEGRVFLRPTEIALSSSVVFDRAYHFIDRLAGLFFCLSVLLQC